MCVYVYVYICICVGICVMCRYIEIQRGVDRHNIYIYIEREREIYVYLVCWVSLHSLTLKITR